MCDSIIKVDGSVFPANWPNSTGSGSIGLNDAHSIDHIHTIMTGKARLVRYNTDRFQWQFWATYPGEWRDLSGAHTDLPCAWSGDDVTHLSYEDTWAEPTE